MSEAMFFHVGAHTLCVLDRIIPRQQFQTVQKIRLYGKIRKLSFACV